MGKIYIDKCNEYVYEEVINVVGKMLSNIPEIQDLKIGTVLVKTNLLKKNKPEDAVTTHPFVVEGVVRFFQSKGHEVIIGDSPGGPFNPHILKNFYTQAGLVEVSERTGCKLNYDTETIDVKVENGKVVNTLKLVKAFVDCDYVVSCAKLKTHTMMTYTGAVKNLFGTVPGVNKADYHLKMNDTLDFANLLIDICDYIKPVVSVIDGIHAMEGNGPSAGDIRKLGLLFAGANPFELDYVASDLVGIKNPPTVTESLKRGLFDTASIEKIGLDFEKLNIVPFKLPESTHVNFISGKIPKFAENYVLDKFRPYPYVNKEKCIGCGICSANCPKKVITIKDKKANINTKNCIRCFCCHELCPEKAVSIKRHPLHKLIFGE
ncbi:DUF362 domain-containing protein [Soehngenia saccharolytica]|nr:DUF362 domain-containing protein [Soehngenia saccharolytica]